MKIKFKNGLKADFNDIEEEYDYDRYFGTNSLAIETLQKLDKAERRLIILYTELGSYSAVGRLLKISHTSAGKEIKTVMEKFKNIYYENLY